MVVFCFYFLFIILLANSTLHLLHIISCLMVLLKPCEKLVVSLSGFAKVKKCRLDFFHFPLFFPCLAGQACSKACAKCLLSFSKVVGIYTYIYTYMLIHIHIYIYHMAFLVLLFMLGRDLLEEGKDFLCILSILVKS